MLLLNTPMTHLTIFLLILLLPFCWHTITRLLRVYREHRFKYLQLYALHLGIIAVSILLSLVNNYIFANLFQRFASMEAIAVEISYRITGIMLDSFLFYVIFYLNRELLQKKISRLFNRVFVGFMLVVLTVAVLFALHAWRTGNAFPLLAMNIIFIFLSYAVSSGVFLNIAFKASRLEPRSGAKAVRAFAVIYSSSMLIILVAIELHILVRLDNNLLIIMFFFQLLVVNGMPLLYLRRFMEMVHGPLTPVAEKSPSAPDPQSLFEKYNISKREQEIVLLVCKGKSNKEIEAELFISLQTVKDHITSIYRKTGLKNRVQLTNLFRGK